VKEEEMKEEEEVEKKSIPTEILEERVFAKI